MSERDRWVDLVREGVDCALRWGELADGGLVARRLAVLTRTTCAAPAYLKRFGRPRSLEDLAGHQIVGLRRFTSGDLEPLNFVVDGKMRSMSLPAPFSVTGPESYLLEALASCFDAFSSREPVSTPGSSPRACFAGKRSRVHEATICEMLEPHSRSSRPI